ncbi:MAG: hypothetical protein U0892_10800 [Pirellulales bacterium]
MIHKVACMLVHARQSLFFVLACWVSLGLNLHSQGMAEDYKPKLIGVWNDTDGEIFGDHGYSPSSGRGQDSLPRGFIRVAGLHRDDVEAFPAFKGFTILRVKSTGKCCLVAHWHTKGEDDGYGVYAVDFEKGGRFVTDGDPSMVKAPRGYRYLNHFPSLKFIRLSLDRGQELDDEESRALESLTALSSLELHGSAIDDALLSHFRCSPKLLELDGTSATMNGIQSMVTSRLMDLRWTHHSKPLEGMEGISRLPQLTRLDLSGSPVSKEMLEALRHSASLRTLSLHQVRIDDDQIPTLLSLGVTMLSLWEASISDHAFRELHSEKPGWMQITEVRNATELNEGRNQQLDFAAKKAKRNAELKDATQWFMRRGGEILIVRTTGNPEAVPKLPLDGVLTDRSAVGKFDARKMALNDEDLAKIATLVSETQNYLQPVLDLSDSAIQGSGFRSWSKGPYEIILNGSKLNDDGAKMLGRLDIRIMRLDRTNVTDEMLPWLPEQLWTLTLNGTQITDQGIKRLADSLADVNLRELELDSTAVTVACAPHIARLSRLERVALRNNGFSPQDRTEFRKQVFHCKIEFD